MTNSFGCVITSFLSIKIPVIPFKTFEEFVDNGQFQLTLPDFGLTAIYFRVKFSDIFLFNQKIKTIDDD